MKVMQSEVEERRMAKHENVHIMQIEALLQGNQSYYLSQK